ncbi:MAG: DegT/DnrJ/EryC1/StrS family aminotransferase [Solirubrobacteraceae bacterium]
MNFSPTLPPPAATPPRVRFLDLVATHAGLRGELERAAARVVSAGAYVLGPELERFESLFAQEVGAAHCVGVGSGLDALTLALAARGVGAGDEVIVPGHTFIATWLAVTRVGAVPVPVDPIAEGFNLDPDAVAAAIGPRTAAIVPVHLYGEPAAVGALRTIACRHGLALVDDAAQAHGASVEERAVGALCDATAWSFYPGKNLGALGDGGAITTDDVQLATRLRRLRNYGSERKYVHVEMGVNSRLDDLQAALLSCKLPYLQGWNARRRAVAARYSTGLASLPVVVPNLDQAAGHVFHLYVIRSPERDALRSALVEWGVETGIHYPIACHRQRVFAGSAAACAELPASERLAAEVLSLPMGPHLSDDDVDHVIDAFCAFYADARGE